MQLVLQQGELRPQLFCTRVCVSVLPLFPHHPSQVSGQSHTEHSSPDNLGALGSVRVWSQMITWTVMVGDA